MPATALHRPAEDERTVSINLTPREAADVWNLLSLTSHDHRFPADYRDRLRTLAARFSDAERSDYLRRNPPGF